MKSKSIIDKIFFLLFLLSTGSMSLKAQNRSIRFESLGFEEVLEKAREMKREVFVDCYTSWCGPCKRMAREVFTVDSIADYFNVRFINVKYDLEKQERQLAKKYSIAGYPTFLILDSNGRLLKRITGYHAPDEWMQIIRNEKPEHSLTELEKRYHSGEHAPEFLGEYLEALYKAQRHPEAARIVASLRLYTTPADIYDRSRWKLFCKYQRSLDAADSRFLLEHADLFRDVLGGNEVDTELEQLFSLKATDFAYWEQRYPQQAFDMQALDSCITRLRSLDFDQSANSLAFLMMEKKIREQQWEEAISFLKVIREIRLMNTTYYLQYFLIYTDRMVALHPPKSILKSLISEYDRLLGMHPSNQLLIQKKQRLMSML